MSTAPYDFKVGDIPPSGVKIAYIYGQSIDVIVYEDERHGMQWMVRPDQLSIAQQTALREFDRLDKRRQQWMPKKGVCGDAIEEMRGALFLALCESEPDKAVAQFADIEAHIDAVRASKSKMLYLGCGFGAAIVMGAIALAMLWLTNSKTVSTLTLLGLALLGGAFGSWTSVLQRTPKLPVALFDVPSWIAFQSVYGVLLGCTFGMVALLALKTNLLASSFLSSTWQFLFLTFIAGFSERFIPELLNRADQSISSAAAEKGKATHGGKRENPAVVGDKNHDNNHDKNKVVDKGQGVRKQTGT